MTESALVSTRQCWPCVMHVETLTYIYIYVYWVGQEVCLGSSVTFYGKTQTNFLANPIYILHHKRYSIACEILIESMSLNH